MQEKKFYSQNGRTRENWDAGLDGQGQVQVKYGEERKQRGAGMEQWKDTPNIGPVLAENLKRIGVAAPEQLRELGAEDAFARIRAQVDPTACLHQLEALAGAVAGVKKSLLPPERKAELKSWYRKL